MPRAAPAVSAEPFVPHVDLPDNAAPSSSDTDALVSPRSPHSTLPSFVHSAPPLPDPASPLSAPPLFSPPAFLSPLSRAPSAPPPHPPSSHAHTLVPPPLAEEEAADVDVATQEELRAQELAAVTHAAELPILSSSTSGTLADPAAVADPAAIADPAAPPPPTTALTAVALHVVHDDDDVHDASTTDAPESLSSHPSPSPPPRSVGAVDGARSGHTPSPGPATPPLPHLLTSLGSAESFALSRSAAPGSRGSLRTPPRTPPPPQTPPPLREQPLRRAVSENNATSGAGSHCGISDLQQDGAGDSRRSSMATPPTTSGAGGRTGEGGDWLELIASASANRINGQRSSAAPSVNLDLSPRPSRATPLASPASQHPASAPPSVLPVPAPTQLSSSAPGPGANATLVEPDPRKSRGFLRRFSKERDVARPADIVLPPIVKISKLFTDSNDTNPDLCFRDDGSTPLIAAQPGTHAVEAGPPPGGTVVARSFDVCSIDPFAGFYREFFHEQDHWTFLGQDDAELGSFVVSLRRECVPADDGSRFQFRAIIRSTKRGTQRILLPQSAIPHRGEPTPKDVLTRLLPRNSTARLAQARLAPKLPIDVLKLDECNANPDGTYKFGVLLCRENQSVEDELYNNEESCPAFDEFLSLLGDRVKLAGFTGFRGGLDLSGATGLETVYTAFDKYKIMFHVSTLLPYIQGHNQQVQRKRHIGNDIVVIVFQCPGAKPLDVSSFASKYTHCIIVVQAVNPNTPELSYIVHTVRKTNVAMFAPPLPPQATFGVELIRGGLFRHFLLTKAINGEHAACQCGHLRTLGERTRTALINDVVTSYWTETGVHGAAKQRSAIVRRIARRKSDVILRSDTFVDVCKESWAWAAKVNDIDAYFVLSKEVVLVIDCDSECVLHFFPIATVLGWGFTQSGLRLFYGRQEDTILLSCSSDTVRAISSVLRRWSSGSLLLELTLRRDDIGQPWGFSVLGAVVVAVARGSTASRCGLTTDHRLFQIDSAPVSLMSQQEVVAAVRAPSALVLHLRVKVLIPPFGLARRGHAGSTQSLNLPLSSSSPALFTVPRTARTLEDGMDGAPALGSLAPAGAPRMQAVDQALLDVMGGGAAVAEAVSLNSRSSSPRARARTSSQTSEARSRSNSGAGQLASMAAAAAAAVGGAVGAGDGDGPRSTASSPGLGDRELLARMGPDSGVVMRRAVAFDRSMSSTEV